MSSTSESVARPPWLSFLLEPTYTALEQARAALADVERELLQLTPEGFSRMKDGIPTDPSPREPDPEDAAWLEAELVKMQGLKSRELADLEKQLVDRLGGTALLRIRLGDDVPQLLKDAGKQDEGLETKIARYKGFLALGEEE